MVSRRYHIYLLLTVIILFSCLSCKSYANPIPVYPEPKKEIVGSSDVQNVDSFWIILIFVIDFCFNILIVYSAIYLLYFSKVLTKEDVFLFSKYKVLLAVAAISLIGIIVELIFAGFLGGLLIALILIFTSYVLISKHFLQFTGCNAIRVGLYAVLINIIMWAIIFML